MAPPFLSSTHLLCNGNNIKEPRYTSYSTSLYFTYMLLSPPEPSPPADKKSADRCNIVNHYRGRYPQVLIGIGRAFRFPGLGFIILVQTQGECYSHDRQNRQ